MSNIEFSVESFDDVYSEMFPLLEQHYVEIAHNKEKIVLDPDVDKYRALCAAGVLHIVTARIDGEIAGYFVSFIAPHIHYKQTVIAQNDVLYVSPKHRGTLLAAKMFKYAESRLKALGVDGIVLHMKVAAPFEKFAERLGYNKFEYNYIKYLE